MRNLSFRFQLRSRSHVIEITTVITSLDTKRSYNIVKRNPSTSPKAFSAPTTACLMPKSGDTGRGNVLSRPYIGILCPHSFHSRGRDRYKQCMHYCSMNSCNCGYGCSSGHSASDEVLSGQTMTKDHTRRTRGDVSGMKEGAVDEACVQAKEADPRR